MKPANTHRRLRPGTYKVVFTLTGFNTVTRDGILEANFTAPINAK